MGSSPRSPPVATLPARPRFPPSCRFPASLPRQALMAKSNTITAAFLVATPASNLVRLSLAFAALLMPLYPHTMPLQPVSPHAPPRSIPPYLSLALLQLVQFTFP